MLFLGTPGAYQDRHSLIFLGCGFYCPLKHHSEMASSLHLLISVLWKFTWKSPPFPWNPDLHVNSREIVFPELREHPCFPQQSGPTGTLQSKGRGGSFQHSTTTSAQGAFLGPEKLIFLMPELCQKRQLSKKKKSWALQSQPGKRNMAIWLPAGVWRALPPPQLMEHLKLLLRRSVC